MPTNFQPKLEIHMYFCLSWKNILVRVVTVSDSSPESKLNQIFYFNYIFSSHSAKLMAKKQGTQRVVVHNHLI